jgi:SAM-dependent methyltransferase
MPGIRSGPRNFFRLFLIKRLTSGKSNAVALDAGCGDGSLSIHLAKKGYAVYAAEEDGASCEILKNRSSALGLKDALQILCSSLENLDFPQGYFDIIVCGEVLEHLEKPAEVLEKFNRYLKKDGWLIISVPLKSKGWDAWDNHSGHKRLYDFYELNGLLKQAGFSIEKYFVWGWPFVKIYHKLIFLPWAKKAKGEEEIRQERLTLTHIGKNYLISVILGLIFFIDILFTPPAKAIGIVLKARPTFP